MTADHERLMAEAYARFGRLLHVSGYESGTAYERTVVDVHLEDSALIPLSLAHRVVEAGLQGVFVGVGMVVDLDEMQFLRDYRPAGWRAHGYEVVGGVYDRVRKFIVVGTTSIDPGEQHDLLHESGHTVGDLLTLNAHEELKALHQSVDVWLHLPRHLRGLLPGDERGLRETLAEAVRDCILDRDAARRRYGEFFVRWLEQELELR